MQEYQEINIPEKPRLLLIKPAIKHPIVREDCDIPLGLVSIVSHLRREMPKGLEINIHDERLSKLAGEDSDGLEYLEDADIVGISACSNEFPKALEIAREAHETGKTTVMGGIFPSGNPSYVLENYPYVDFVVAGEGEIALTKLVEALKSRDNEALAKIKGLWRRENGAIVNGGVAERLQKIPEITHVYQQGIVDPEEYFTHVHRESHRGRIIPTMASRGCIGGCSMCSLSSVWKGERTARSVDDIIDEIALLQNVNGVDGINFRDDELFSPLKFAKELFTKIIEAKKQGRIRPELKFKCKSRIKSMNEQMLDLLAEAGVYCVQYGVETTNGLILREMKKVTLDQVRKVLEGTQRRGMVINPTFIFGGLEGQTFEDLVETSDFIASFGRYPDIKPYFTFFTPHPRDGLFTIERGHKIISQDLNDFTHKRPIVESDELPIERVIEAHSKVVEATGTSLLNPPIKQEHLDKLRSAERIGDNRLPVY